MYSFLPSISLYSTLKHRCPRDVEEALSFWQNVSLTGFKSWVSSTYQKVLIFELCYCCLLWLNQDIDQSWCKGEFRKILDHCSGRERKKSRNWVRSGHILLLGASIVFETLNTSQRIFLSKSFFSSCGDLK